MQHCILVKFNDTVPDRAALCREIEAFWQNAPREIAGVSAVTFRRCVIDRPNRYDLLIRLTMEKDVLGAFDASALHNGWKETYGPRLAQKAIFDYED